ncbi:MAG TPA: phosphatase domain-containing protein [Pyrinomonadaceae bacterium]|nr:phosphatase domain-containing protein [Pyrinomonadaceae bacterium]
MFDKKLTFYPTYGYRPDEQGDWLIPVRAWVRNERPLPPDALIRLCFDEDGDLGERAMLRFKECLRDFWAADNEGEEVSVKFDHDPEGKTYRLDGETNGNGLLEGELRLDDAEAERLVRAQHGAGASTPGALTLTAHTRGLSGSASARGVVRLLEPRGLSVVSDIDDTVKVTEIPAGPKTFLRRTFLMDFEATQGMRDRYLNVLKRNPDFDNVSFHYVSGSPWQLFRLLHEFLVEREGFPRGSFHMKSVNLDLEDLRGSFGSIRNLLSGGEHTEGMKVETISELLRRMPGRKFILVGDTGERDPEVFRRVKRDFGEQVVRVYIRDVNDLGEQAERIKDMFRIDPQGVCLQEQGA